MRYGEINRGVIRRTEGQVKKHCTQMDKQEKEFLKDKLNNLKQNNIFISDHLSRKFIGYDLDVVKTLPFKNNVEDLIIEYNERPMDTYTDRRVLLRTTESYEVKIGNQNKKCNLCVVYSIVTSNVITVYWNTIEDNHNTINWNRYDKNLKIIY